MKKTFTHLDLATDKTRQETRQDRRREKITIVGFEPSPTPAPTALPDRGTKQTSTEPSASTKIEAFDSSHSPSHSIRLEYLC
ncbi:hypothetical protein PoB_005104400 [Plakobranchus ocellatus]|uniref:Uncharacterized protein n=1 Tax=Plakobranchus ocellatus TaxID=259542 RepID=A0AAV4C1I1_9GAST|nr:hypothetical protein PoB_005104400 [Plakobranchus ocellatus]